MLGFLKYVLALFGKQLLVFSIFPFELDVAKSSSAEVAFICSSLLFSAVYSLVSLLTFKP